MQAVMWMQFKRDFPIENGVSQTTISVNFAGFFPNSDYRLVPFHCQFILQKGEKK